VVLVGGCLNLQAVLEAREQLHARVLRWLLADVVVVRGSRGGAALLLVAGVRALVRDVEDAQVGVRALHLLRGQAPLRRAVRAPVVAPATTSCQCWTLDSNQTWLYNAVNPGSA
jgi:hypothetical protein